MKYPHRYRLSIDVTKRLKEQLEELRARKGTQSLNTYIRSVLTKHVVEELFMKKDAP